MPQKSRWDKMLQVLQMQVWGRLQKSNHGVNFDFL